MTTPANPITSLMSAASEKMSNPMASSVPPSGGIVDPSQHPVVAAIIKALASGASSYGWTSMPPQQRLEAQQLEAQKAETMARLAQTGAYQQGELAYRGQLADVAARNAATREKEETRRQSWDEFQQGMKKQVETDRVAHNQALEALGKGRIEEASKHNAAYLQSVKNRYKVAEENVGIGYGRLHVQEDLANILRYRSQLEAIATQQRGTDAGVKAQLELGKLESDHWLQNLLGAGGIPTSQGAVQTGVPLPGAPGPAGVGPGGAPIPAPPQPTNKVAAKRQQRAPAPVTAPGATEFVRRPDGSIGPK